MSQSKKCRINKLSVDKDPVPKQKVKNTPLKSNLNINSQNLVICRVGTFDQHYMINGKIGQGSFGTVYRIKHKTLHFQRALKIIKKRVNLVMNTSSFEEIQVLKMLDHANILKIYEFYDTAENYYIVTEIFPGEELFDFILKEEKLSEQDAAQILKEVLRALVYTHSLKIAHRDLKPQNILIRKSQDQYKIKIIDWGLGTLMGDIKSNRICGTPEYCAPEVLKGCYSLNCDMWSLGAIAYVMMTGEMPFTGNNTEDTIEVVKKGNLNTRIPSFKTLSVEAQEFIVSLMSKNENKRLKAVQAIEHAWIVKNTLKQAKPVFLKETLQRLRDFNVGNKLGVAVLSLINNHMSQQKERQKLQQIFKHLDKNNDGVLSIIELIEGYSDLHGKQLGTKIAEDTFNKLDINNNGNLEFSQFVTFGLKQQKLQHQQRLRQAFSLFDRDKNGKISKEQIQFVLRGKVSAQIQSQIGEIIQQVDKNGDCQIDIEQFMKCLQNIYEGNKEDQVENTLKTTVVIKVQKKVQTNKITLRKKKQVTIQKRQKSTSTRKIESKSRAKK